MKEARGEQILDISEVDLQDFADRVWMWGKVLPWKICGGRGQKFGKMSTTGESRRKAQGEALGMTEMNNVTHLALTCVSLGREEDVLSSGAAGPSAASAALRAQPRHLPHGFADPSLHF